MILFSVHNLVSHNDQGKKICPREIVRKLFYLSQFFSVGLLVTIQCIHSSLGSPFLPDLPSPDLISMLQQTIATGGGAVGGGGAAGIGTGAAGIGTGAAGLGMAGAGLGTVGTGLGEL